MESTRTRDVALGPVAEEEIFRPWRSQASYVILLAFLAGLLVVFWYAETHGVLESQIALGIDPDRVVKFVSLAIGAFTFILTFTAIRARRFLLATGELRFLESTLIVSTASSSVAREISELQESDATRRGPTCECCFETALSACRACGCRPVGSQRGRGGERRAIPS